MSGNIKILNTEVLHQSKYRLQKVTFQNGSSGKELTHEVYHRGNAAAVLLYNKTGKTVVLTKQFRLPSFLNGNPGGMLIEVCAGMLDGDDPATCARREAEEETGYKIEAVQHAFDVYTSPGGVTELLHCFVASYTPDMKVSRGGGLASEGEKIELLEPTLDAALQMIATGEIKDAKTIMLLQHAKLHNLV
jgi:nudix-type nucleoside diphosphatase (YffH/AdpP family)